MKQPNRPTKNNKTKNPVKNWMVNYIDSPIYQERLKVLDGNINPTSRQDILNTHLLFNAEQSTLSLPKDNVESYLEYDAKGTFKNQIKKGVHNVNLDPFSNIKTKDIYNSYKDTKLANSIDSPDSDLAHELSHLQRNLNLKEKVWIDALRDKKVKIDDHDRQPMESKADLDALRYMMYKKGIYDTSKRDMTLDDLNKAKKDKDINNSFLFNRLQKSFSPEDIILMNNNIANNYSNDNNDIFTAKNGGEVPNNKLMSTKNSKYKYGSYVVPKYDLGSWVKPMGTKGAGIASGATALTSMVGGAIGGSAGNVVSGLSSGVAAGAALGPLGMIGGGILGAGLSLLGNKKAKEAAEGQRTEAYNSMSKSYKDQFEANYDINNENPYGTQVYANGGMIDPEKKNKSGYAPVPKNMKWTNIDYTTKGGNLITQANLDDYLKAGLDFGNDPKLLGNYIDSMPTGTPLNTTGMNYPKGNYKYQYDSPDYKIAAKRFATGGEVPIEQINIEKGELQIDPTTGKILREYTGMNPETGGLYKPHSKGKDPMHNFVTAEPGTFIITTKEAKKYKDAIDNNDKLHQNSILQNIKNYKDSIEPKAKMANGSFVDWDTPLQMDITRGMAGSRGVYNIPLNPTVIQPQAQMTTGLAPLSVGKIPNQSSFNMNGVGNVIGQLANYAPALTNIGQGLFGNVDEQARVNPILNPYKREILNNMPQDVSLEPIRQQLYRDQNAQFNQIDNTTNGSPIARANKLNVFANTQNQLGNFGMQTQLQNNQIRGQRAGIYQGLGGQEMAAQDRAQQINLGIDEGNRANRGAKQNLLSTGLSQLQQTYQNERLNKSRQAMDKYKVDLLRQMFPNLKYYGDQFGEDALSKLIGQ